MDNWFESWFDSEYYHLLYSNRNEEEAQFFMTNLLNLLNLDDSASLLDLACGKGRHSLFLASKGYDVCGVDLSPQSIEYANKMSNEKLNFFVHDMREKINEKYDCVLNLFTSFGYFNTIDEHILTLKNMSDALKNNKSYLVIDFINANKTIKNLILSEKKKVKDLCFNINRYILNNTITKNIQFNSDNKHYFFQENVKAFQLEDFEKMLSIADLRIEKIFGDYSLNDFDKEKSDRLIILAKKR